ncbi:hypothetical protein SANA_00720 [Gottschalkiaceae bacterium SANA]|nr:hypothetical protein SANA_00720 [Gottschalkiaceae bacterium SANA]
MRTKKIYHQFLKAYILIFFMVLVLGALTLFAYDSYTETRLNKSSIDFDTFIEDYDQNRETAFSKHAFQPDDFIVITDRDYKILDAVNLTLSEGTTYHDLQLLMGNDELYSTYIFENESGSRVYHLFLAPLSDETNSYYFFLAIAFALFILFIISYAKITGEKIIRPINQLNDGVREIQKGNFDHLIQYEAGTELDEIKDEINRMSQHLKAEIEQRKQLEEERSKLMLNLSHDIKTPLTNILGYAQILTQQDLPEQAHQQAETIYRYGLLASNLTKELFTYSRLNSKIDFLTERLDIVEETRRKSIAYLQEFDSLNIQYDFDFPDKAIYCQLNIALFSRAIDNLIQNSIQYNHQGFQLNMRIIETLKTVQLIVEDNGIGIPKAYHDTIFNPMVRVEKSRNRSLGGSGLGLSITQQVIKKHGGSIYLDSSHTKGCRFILTFPKA